MKKLLILVLLLASCKSEPKGTPKFKAGDRVYVGVLSLDGQVLEMDCNESPCKYVVRYLPPKGDYKKETFGEVELRPYDPKAH